MRTLPIDYRHSFTLQKKTILLYTPWFRNNYWSINSLKSPQTQSFAMDEIGCPFLSDFCDITADQHRFNDAEAVVFHLSKDRFNMKNATVLRKSSQRFVFALWEPPTHTSSLTSYDSFFNWTMTYRLDSHIVATYFYQRAFVQKQSAYYKNLLGFNATNKSLKSYYLSGKNNSFEKRKGTAAALITNCGDPSKRLHLISKLRKFIDVTVYGGCGQPCPVGVDCREYVYKNYYFILSFENSLCRDYVSKCTQIVVSVVCHWMTHMNYNII